MFSVLVALTLMSAHMDGKAVFKTYKCAVCHSIAGEGNKKGPLDGIGARLTVPQIREAIVNPRKTERKPAMKPYKLPEHELGPLVEYLASLK